MSVDIQIEGVSVIGGYNSSGRYYVDLESVDVEQDIALQQTSAKFDLHIIGTESGGVWQWPIKRPIANQDVVFYNAAGGREFGGILLQPEESEWEPNHMVYACQCSDYSKWFDRHLVNAQYQAGITAAALIDDIVTTYVNTPGNTRIFTTNNVQTSPSIPLPFQQFVYIPPSEVLGQLVQALGWGFFIDFNRDVNFYSTESNVSPLPNNTLDADALYNDPTNISGVADWMDLVIEEDSSQLKNQVYITGITLAAATIFTQGFTADGSTTIFTLGYQPPNDTSAITVSVGGVQYQIGLDLIDSYPGGPCEAQTAYVNFSQQTIRFCTAPASGALIKVNFYPMGPAVVRVDNVQSQQYMASVDGTDGVYAYNRMDPSLSAETPALAQQRANMTLTKYAYPLVTGTFKSFLPGWSVAQYFTFRSQRRMQGSYDGTNFYVIKLGKKIVNTNSGDWFWEYTVNFRSKPFEF